MDNWKKVFGIIWTGQFLSLFSSTVVGFSIIVWMSLETGSATMLAWAAIAGLLPQIILGPVSGVFIDRWNRKKVMMLADTFIAACTLILAVLFWLGIAKMWFIFILLALRSVGSAFHMPAMQASIPLLAPSDQLTRIAGINQIIQSVGNIIGPAVGAFLVTVMEIHYILLFDVLGALFAVFSLVFVHIPNPERQTDRTAGVWKELKEGVMEVWKSRGMTWLFVYCIITTTFLMPVSVLFPLMTLDHFGGTAYQVGLIEVVWGIGALLGGFVMGAKVYQVNRVGLINWMYLLIGATFLLSGLLSPEGFGWFVVLTTIAGASGAVYNSAFTGIVQTYIDPAALGRVFSMFFTVSLIPSLFALTGIGFFSDTLGLTASFVLCGGIIMLTGVAAFLTPSMMKMR